MNSRTTDTFTKITKSFPLEKILPQIMQITIGWINDTFKSINSGILYRDFGSFGLDLFINTLHFTLHLNNNNNNNRERGGGLLKYTILAMAGPREGRRGDRLSLGH